MDILADVPVERIKSMVRTHARAVEALRVENARLRRALDLMQERDDLSADEAYAAAGATV